MTREDFIEKWIDELLGLALSGLSSNEIMESQNAVHRDASRGRYFAKVNDRVKCLLGRIHEAIAKSQEKPPRVFTVDEIVAEFMERYEKLTVDKHTEIKEKLRAALKPQERASG